MGMHSRKAHAVVLDTHWPVHAAALLLHATAAPVRLPCTLMKEHACFGTMCQGWPEQVVAPSLRQRSRLLSGQHAHWGVQAPRLRELRCKMAAAVPL